MPTFQTLQDRVTRRVVDLPASVLTEVPDLINKALRTLQEMHNFKVMETETAQLTTTVATRPLSAAIPANLKEFRGLPYLVRNDGHALDLLLAANRNAALDRFSLNDPNDKGEPRLLLDPEADDDTGTRTLEVFPFPDGLSDWSGGEYRVVVPYWRYVTALSVGTDANWFTSNAEWYLTFQATAEAFYLDWDEARGQLWETRAGGFAPDGRGVGEFNRVLKQDKLARLGGVRHLSFSLDVFGANIRS